MKPKTPPEHMMPQKIWLYIMHRDESGWNWFRSPKPKKGRAR